MRITEGYVLRNLNGTHYLLPLGQNIALHRNSIRLNSSGVLLWNALNQGCEIDDLLPMLVKYYDLSEAEIPMIQSDINSFLHQLVTYRLLLPENKTFACDKYFKIGNLVIGYQGPVQLIHPFLNDFLCDPEPVGQYWYIIQNLPDMLSNGEQLIKTREIEIYRNNSDYTLILLTYTTNIIVKISLDGTRARFYYQPPLDCALTEPLFHAFRHAFLLYAQNKGFFVMHSSSILYKNKAWLFSAPSGTGKSTLAKFWNKEYHTPILNGDLNLISLQNSELIVWGLPWCGTSGQYCNKAFPLGGIALLKQYHDNLIQNLDRSEQQLLASQRLISPTWTEQLLDLNLNFIGSLIEHVSVFRYLCRKETAAARVLQEYIDKLITP